MAGIAFESRAGGEANIYLVDPQGGVPRKLEIDIALLGRAVGACLFQPGECLARVAFQGTNS